jgi:hypothetical protein
MFEHRQVTHLKDMSEVSGIRRGHWIGFAPRLVAGPTGELGECLPTVGVGGPRHVSGREKLGFADKLDPQCHGSHLWVIDLLFGGARGAVNSLRLAHCAFLSDGRGCERPQRNGTPVAS